MAELNFCIATIACKTTVIFRMYLKDYRYCTSFSIYNSYGEYLHLAINVAVTDTVTPAPTPVNVVTGMVKLAPVAGQL